jgi:Sec-independent protein translocase protein TatA
MFVLGLLALLVFGPEGLPGIIKTVMRTVNAVKAAARDFQTEVNTALNDEHERKDLAQRQRQPFVEVSEDDDSQDPAPPPQQIGIAAETMASETEEAIEDDVEPETEDAVEGDAETETEGTVENQVEPEADDSVEEEVSERDVETEEEVDDDDGPRVPMGSAPRRAPEEEATEVS